MIAIPVNQIKGNSIRGESIRTKRNKTRQAHCQAILICCTAVIIDANDIKRRAIKKRSNKILCTFNGKVATDSI